MKKDELAIQPQTPNPANLLEMAIQKGADIAQLKELMDLQERWEKKEARKAFFDALSLFQSKVPVISKKKTAKINSQKGSYSYKFADLGEITKQVSPILRECGLSYRWEFDEKNGQLKVTCLLSHRDGHTETTAMEAGKDTSGYKNDIQQKGSTQTYLQRYTLIGALGLSTADQDNDGKSHSEPVEARELSDEEVLDQWQQQVNQCKTMIELTGLFMKNKKAVEGNENVKAIFKKREAELKPKQQPKVSMP